MKNKGYPALLLAVLVFLCGCGPQNYTEPVAQATQVTTVPSTEAVLPEASTSELEETRSLHSELYLEEYSQEEIIQYFSEVVLNVEYSDGTGTDDAVQKWLSPLFYRVYGDPTETDLEVLTDWCGQLNEIPGFPGIYPAEEGLPENLSIHFLEPEAFFTTFSELLGGEDAFGAAQYWYFTDTNELHTARIGCRTDISQEERDSVLREEVINVLGITDTLLRPDSITYQHSNDNLCLSDVDRIILELLYSSAIKCGMNADSCACVIRQLYY